MRLLDKLKIRRQYKKPVDSKEEAEAGRKDANYILTAKIEWEE